MKYLNDKTKENTVANTNFKDCSSMTPIALLVISLASKHPSGANLWLVELHAAIPCGPILSSSPTHGKAAIVSCNEHTKQFKYMDQKFTPESPT